MNIKKLLVAAAGLAAAASLIGLGAGAAFTDQATASQHVAVGNINLQVSANGTDFGKQATYNPSDNISGWGTGLITENVWLRNTGSLKVIVTPLVSVQGHLPVVITQLRYDYAPNSLVTDTTLASGQTSMFTFTYQVNNLTDANKGQDALITVTANGVG